VLVVVIAKVLPLQRPCTAAEVVEIDALLMQGEQQE
jgi:hypothetical protein